MYLLYVLLVEHLTNWAIAFILPHSVLVTFSQYHKHYQYDKNKYTFSQIVIIAGTDVYVLHRSKSSIVYETGTTAEWQYMTTSKRLAEAPTSWSMLY